MPPKRKADVIEELSQDAPPAGPSAEASTSATGSTKKVRLENASAEASSSAQPATPDSWRDITLEGEDEVCIVVLLSLTIKSHHHVNAGRRPCLVSLSLRSLFLTNHIEYHLCSDDCNEIRRKIRLLEKKSGFKVLNLP